MESISDACSLHVFVCTCWMVETTLTAVADSGLRGQAHSTAAGALCRDRRNGHVLCIWPGLTNTSLLVGTVESKRAAAQCAAEEAPPAEHERRRFRLIYASIEERDRANSFRLSA